MSKPNTNTDAMWDDFLQKFGHTNATNFGYPQPQPHTATTTTTTNGPTQIHQILADLNQRVQAGQRAHLPQQQAIAPHQQRALWNPYEERRELLQQKHQTSAAPQPLARPVNEDLILQDDNTHRNETVFEEYKSCSAVDFGVPHPGNISESGLLATVSLPTLDYPFDVFCGPHAPSCALSRLQLEGVLFACQKHLTIFPNGERAGFFIGDSTGVGKGRQVAGIIFDNFVRGRKKHVWISVSNDLAADARRDLADVNCHISFHTVQSLLSCASAVSAASSKNGCLFVTYSMLSSSRGEGASRVDQIVNWCGSDFSGCLIFDEAHKAKNFNFLREDASTKMSKAVIELQARLPKARVVYCSATGVTDIGNLAYAGRLGLWGQHTPFPNFADFKARMEMRGLASLELLAVELKRAGSFISRGLSFQGAEFETSIVALDPGAVAMYDNAALFWCELKMELADAMDRTHDPAARRVWSQFWATCQRFFRELANASKTTAIVEKTKVAIASGMSVVIGLQSTGESGLERALEEANFNSVVHQEVSDFVSPTRVALVQFIKTHFPTTVPDETGRDTITSTGKVEVLRIECARLVEQKRSLVARAEALSLPASPIDTLIDQLGGPQCVAEMTGRGIRIVRKANKLVVEMRGSGSDCESVNITERKHFVNGNKYVAIISDAASTGISLHAHSSSKNAHRRRLHITMELSWSADKTIQQLGRSHRTNQNSAPVFELLVTDLGGERRFCSAVANRLASMGAMTKGDRRAATGVDFSDFNVDSSHGRAALSELCGNCQLNKPTQGVPLTETQDPQTNCPIPEELWKDMIRMGLEQKHFSNVKIFLGRLLILPVQKQNRLFGCFSAALQRQIEIARNNGTFEDGVADVQGRELYVEEEVQLNHGLSPELRSVLARIVIDRGASWAEAKDHLDSVMEQMKDWQHAPSFYESHHRDALTKSNAILLAIPVSDSCSSFAITRPITGKSSRLLQRSELFSKYKPVDVEAAQQLWDHQFSVGDGFGRSKRKSRLKLFCGNTLQHWDTLQKLLHAQKDVLPASQQNLKAIRCSARSGADPQSPIVTLIGVKIVDEIESQLLSHFSQLQGSQQSKREPVAPINPKLMRQASTPKATLATFFQRTQQLQTDKEDVIVVTSPNDEEPPQQQRLTSHPQQEGDALSRISATPPLSTPTSSPDPDRSSPAEGSPTINSQQSKPTPPPPTPIASAQPQSSKQKKLIVATTAQPKTATQPTPKAKPQGGAKRAAAPSILDAFKRTEKRAKVLQ